MAKHREDGRGLQAHEAVAVLCKATRRPQANQGAKAMNNSPDKL